MYESQCRKAGFAPEHVAPAPAIAAAIHHGDTLKVPAMATGDRAAARGLILVETESWPAADGLCDQRRERTLADLIGMTVLRDRVGLRTLLERVSQRGTAVDPGNPVLLE